MVADIIYQGDDVTIEFATVDVDNNPINITGAELFCDARQGTGPEIAASSTSMINAVGGTWSATFSAATTQNWLVGKVYTYDGRVRLISGRVHTVGYGEVRVKDPVTRQPR